MTTLADFLKTDLVDDHVADDINKLIANALRAEYANTETITATKELSDGDCQFQVITPSGANRTVELAPESTTNHVTIIHNAGATYSILVKDDSGVNTYATLSPNEWAMFIPINGISWKKLFNGGETSTSLDLRLTWNSTTSITVETGSCYAENDDFIDVTSALVKSGLSLSNDTWYHVYVYLSSGAPAAEVVTTAPAAWRGTAYSKTGDTSRRYVGSIRTGGSANVLAFAMLGNQVLYAEDEPTILRVLSGGSATTESDVSLATRIPVTSRMALLTLANASGGGQILYTGASGVDNVAPPTTGIVTVAGGANKSTWHPTDEAQNISYALSAAGGGVNINCAGYLFAR